MFQTAGKKKRYLRHTKDSHNKKTLTPNDYPLYSKFYELTKNKFFALIGKLKPKIVEYVPKQIKYRNSIVPYNGKYLFIEEDWGDRLLAAIGYGVDAYVGVDPNESLHEHYNNMIKMLVEPEKQKNFIVLNDGFETANIPKDYYDIVFPSPPFFDLESYSKSEKDSVVAHPTVDKWYNDFLIVSLKKAYDNLIMGGHMVLYMGFLLYARKYIKPYIFLYL